MKFFAFILTVILFSSCADLKKGEQLEAIDSMSKTVDSISTVLIENKYEEIKQISVESYEVQKKIKENFSSDTISIEFAKKLDKFKVMIESFDLLNKQFILLNENSKEEKVKLESLNKDITTASGQRDKYEEFIQFEKVKVQQLSNLLKEYIELRKTTLNTYETLYDEIYEFSFSFMAK